MLGQERFTTFAKSGKSQWRLHEHLFERVAGAQFQVEDCIHAATQMNKAVETDQSELRHGLSNSGIAVIAISS